MVRVMSFAVALCGIALCVSEAQAQTSPDVVMFGKFASGSEIGLGCHEKTLRNGTTTVVGGGKVTSAAGVQHPFVITSGSYTTSGATLFGIVGMVVAVPVAGSIQILLNYFFPKLAKPPPSLLMSEPPPLQ